MADVGLVTVSLRRSMGGMGEGFGVQGLGGEIRMKDEG
jgi:hypothetical protein